MTNMDEIYDTVLAYKRKGLDGVLVTAVEKKGEGPVEVGKKLFVGEDGKLYGTVGGGALEHEAIDTAKELVKDRENRLVRYLLQEDGPQKTEKDHTSLPMKCGGMVTLFYEFTGTRRVVYVFGAGHVSRALGKILKTLDFHLVVIDDRPEVLAAYPFADRPVEKPFVDFIDEEGLKEGAFVVVCTPSHKHDYDVIDRIIEKGFTIPYMGMLCSKAKRRDYLDNLKRKFGTGVDLKNFYAPVGLATGGDTPEEIALSIAAEMLAVANNKKGHLHMRESKGDKDRYWED